MYLFTHYVYDKIHLAVYDTNFFYRIYMYTRNLVDETGKVS